MGSTLHTQGRAKTLLQLGKHRKYHFSSHLVLQEGLEHFEVLRLLRDAKKNKGRCHIWNPLTLNN